MVELPPHMSHLNNYDAPKLNKFQIISPVDGSIYAERTYASNEEIEAILELSNSSQKVWKKTHLNERKTICAQAIQYFQDNVNDIAMEITMMMGRPIRYTPSEISGGFRERALHMIEIADEALANVQPTEIDGFKRFIKKEPLGTVLVLSPWNYPYLTAVNAIIPAILSGNSVILKHSDQTALCAERFAEAFQLAGLPKGVFQFLHITHDQVAGIIQDKRIDHVSFTGSVGGGNAIQQSVNQRFISAGLELGGKDAAYVRDDAILKPTVENLVDGSFFNSGQSCCGIERIYVHEKIYDRFISMFAQMTVEYNIGDPRNEGVTIGPMVRVSNAEKVQAQINEALSKGARSIIDSSTFPSHLGPPYITPQILVNVDHSMNIMTEETFGPVAAIMKVSGDDEAIDLMNDSQYGLTASIWSADEDKVLELADSIDVGTVFMNRCDYLDPTLAWTGVKNSGKGCTLSSMGFDQFTRPKSYHMKLP